MKKEKSIQWEADPTTGLFLPKMVEKPVTTKDLAADSFAKSERLNDAMNRISSDPRVIQVIHKKSFDAMYAWAVGKMGLKRRQYWEEAFQTFLILCALTVAQTNRDIQAVAEETPFDFPLQLSKKRTAFTDQIPQLYEIAAEYDQVHELVERSKKSVKAAAQFRLALRENLERWAEAEHLRAVPRDRLDKLLKDYHLRTSPSQIAYDYVGCRRAISGANVKKLVLTAKNPKLLASLLSKHMKKSYLPTNLDAILKQASMT